MPINPTFWQKELQLNEIHNRNRLALASIVQNALQSGTIDNALRSQQHNPNGIPLWGSDLYAAVQNESVELVEFFVRYGDFIKNDCEHVFQQSMQTAIFNNNLAIVKLLVQQGITFSTPSLEITNSFITTVDPSYKKELSDFIEHKISPARLAEVLKRQEINNYFSEVQTSKRKVMSIEHIIHPNEQTDIEAAHNTVTTPRP